jgi:hypothetical protein
MSDQYSGEGKALPTLEQEIDAIEKLDRLRTRFEELRESALNQLCQIVVNQKSENSDCWIAQKEEPAGLIGPALVCLAATRDFARQINAAQRNDCLEIVRATLADATIDRFFAGDSAPLLPKLQAARTLRASLATPATVFSRTSMLAYYALVRELATVSENKVYGGARATEGGITSAFMTGESARAIRAMADCLKNTALATEALLQMCREFKTIESLESDGGDKAFGTWITRANKRVALSSITSVIDRARRSAVDLPIEQLKPLGKDGKPDWGFFVRFCKDFKKAANGAFKSIDKAWKIVGKHYEREKQEAKRRGDAGFEERTSMAHGLAQRTLEHARALAKMAANVADDMEQYVRSPAPLRIPGRVKAFLNRLHTQSTEVERLLASTAMHLESVLAREVERASNGPFNAGELICAAASYAHLVHPELDRRLERAAELACRALAFDGTFPSVSSLDTDSRGYRAVIYGSELLRALAQLLEKVDLSVDPEVIKRVLSYFERKAVPGSGGLVGWTTDEPRYPLRASRWTSAIAILAIDQIVRMLNKQINSRVGRHFAARKPQEIANRLRLDQLFYSDFGLAGCVKKYPDSENAGESVSFFLERMRAHVLGIDKLLGYRSACFSLLLYGPPGTGKTSLVEALATSSGANYVEITPSDLLVEGEPMFERRARHVFRCLSYLSNTVILFDELDPLIRSRDEGAKKLDIWAFVTPGMLPKLKLLNEQAKKRNLVYCLSTNRVATLDEAAIRQGRFDYRVGVYPPDLVSRAGRMAYVLASLGQWERVKRRGMKRLLSVIDATAGRGMTYLGKPGNYSPPKNNEPAPSGSLLHYIIEPSEDSPPPMPEADADPRKHGVQTETPVSELEKVHWAWVRERDEQFKSLVAQELKGKSAADLWKLFCDFMAS